MSALLFVAFLAVADDPIIEIPFSVPCNASGLCIIPEAVLDKILDVNKEMGKEIAELRAQVKKPVECAKTEITEPSKAPKLPQFKPERNS